MVPGDRNTRCNHLETRASGGAIQRLVGGLSTLIPHTGNRRLPLFIEPGSLWEKGYNESCTRKLRDELLDRENVYALEEAKILIE